MMSAYFVKVWLMIDESANFDIEQAINKKRKSLDIAAKIKKKQDEMQEREELAQIEKAHNLVYLFDED